MLKKIYFAALAIFLLQMGCDSKNDNPDPITPAGYIKNTIAYNTINGVDQNLLSLDIYHFGPSMTPKPVIVYVHGGGWRVGDKSNAMIDKTNLFFSLDYIFISVNYRLSPATSSNDPNRIMYPVHNNDVADSIKWIYENISSYGGNPDKIALLGHSAGAHLVSLTGTSNVFLPARNMPLTTIKGVASIDTEGYDVVSQCNANNEIYLNAFGNIATNWIAASPINNVIPGNSYPAFFIAKRGSAARIANSDAFIVELQSAGTAVTQVNGSQYDHEGINDAIGFPGETAITEPLTAFFASCFQ